MLFCICLDIKKYWQLIFFLKGPLWLTGIQGLSWVRAWINNYTLSFLWDVITYMCSGFNSTQWCPGDLFNKIGPRKTRVLHTYSQYITATRWQILIWYVWNTWWCLQIEAFSAILVLWEGNPSITGKFPSQRPFTQNFDVFFDLRANTQENNRNTGDFRRHRAHYEVIVMICCFPEKEIGLNLCTLPKLTEI